MSTAIDITALDKNPATLRFHDAAALLGSPSGLSFEECRLYVSQKDPQADAVVLEKKAEDLFKTARLLWGADKKITPNGTVYFGQCGFFNSNAEKWAGQIHRKYPDISFSELQLGVIQALGHEDIRWAQEEATISERKTSGFLWKFIGGGAILLLGTLAGPWTLSYVAGGAFLMDTGGEIYRDVYKWKAREEKMKEADLCRRQWESVQKQNSL